MFLQLVLAALLYLVSPVSAAVQSVGVNPTGPLEWTITWVEQEGIQQTYTLTIRDLPGRVSWVRPGIPAGQLSFIANSVSASEFTSSTGDVWTGLLGTKTYAIQVRGVDNIAASLTAGYPLDSAGAPTSLTMCDVNDETSVPQMFILEPERRPPPSGCQSVQLNRKLRFYWEEPTESG
jgi:hypothetical protein